MDKSGQTSSLQRSSTCQWRSATNRWGISQLPALLKTQSKFRWHGLPIKDNQILLPQGSMLHDHSSHSWDATSTLHRTKVLMDHDKLRETEREREKRERETFPLWPIKNTYKHNKISQASSWDIASPPALAERFAPSNQMNLAAQRKAPFFEDPNPSTVTFSHSSEKAWPRMRASYGITLTRWSRWSLFKM